MVESIALDVQVMQVYNQENVTIIWMLFSSLLRNTIFSVSTPLLFAVITYLLIFFFCKHQIVAPGFYLSLIVWNFRHSVIHCELLQWWFLIWGSVICSPLGLLIKLGFCCLFVCNSTEQPCTIQWWCLYLPSCIFLNEIIVFLGFDHGSPLWWYHII